jgi:hypothetical protein
MDLVWLDNFLEVLVIKICNLEKLHFNEMGGDKNKK